MITRKFTIIAAFLLIPAVLFAGWTEYGPLYELVFGIDFVNSDLGWTAGGQDGVGPRINHSTDGGRTWVNQTSDITTMFWWDVDFANENVGVASGMAAFLIYGSVTKTTNGGKDWNIVYNQSPIAVFTDVQLLDENTIIAAGMWTQWLQSKNGVIISDDGGATWDKCHWGTNSKWVSTADFIDRQHGWLVGGTWPTDDSYGILNMRHPSVVLGNAALADEEYTAMVKRTNDGGSTWQTVFDRDGFSVSRACFINRNEGWITCTYDDGQNYKSKIFHTLDSGDTWEEQNIPCAQYATLSDIHFFNRREGWAVGFRSGLLTVQLVLIHTLDGGETWVEDPFSTNIGPLSMVWLNESEGWTTGANDFQYSRVCHFTDPSRAPRMKLSNLSPPASGHAGETLQWNVGGRNLTGGALHGDLWLSVTGPGLPYGYSPYLVPQYYDVTLPGGGEGQVQVSLTLPDNTPAGVYDVEVLFGPYGSEDPYEIIAYDQFDIEVN